MALAETLGVRPGVTSVIGSGGKTSLLAALARELPGTVVLTTTTHILPFPNVPLAASADVNDVRAALAKSRVVCVGSQAEKNGKLVTPELGVDALASLADYVLVEADGARRLPLKAHAAWEPVIPACSGRTVLVLGASGLDRPVREAVHRPELFCELAGCLPDDPATPELVARAANAEALADVALVNQADVAPERSRDLAALLDVPAVTGSLRAGSATSPR
ncbi:putative selenium-dependent hydroxylase accessory protein YqeC [Olsenella uli]|uniref:selenium cofactor biosynthesis protein YqeC n=1 Tax=Olsenella uli TaxID=133926 RepID=UPI001959128D|nr:selenium cofactor biosynthesis protein YqeC [Olsenella uli]MBM6676352.1 putative selenium-dependent hydroxylase accessory protein YqeC [Olsenella uli]